MSRRVLGTQLNPTGGVEHRRRQREYHRDLIVQDANAVIQKLAPELLSREHGITVRKSTVDNIAEQLPVCDTIQDQKTQRNHLRYLLTSGRRQFDWDVEKLPDLIITHAVDPSPFQPTQFASASAISNIYARHLENLRKPLVQRCDEDLKNSARRRAGQILFSAIFGGALLDHGLLRKLKAVITNPIAMHGPLAWIEFELQNQTAQTDDQGTPRLRRWIIDPVTLTLLLRWKKDGLVWPADERSSIDALLTHYAGCLGVTCRKLPNKHFVVCLPDQDASLHSTHRSMEAFLIQGAEIWWRLRLPQAIVDFARKATFAASLPSGAWHRALVGGRLPAEPQDSQSNLLDELTPDEPDAPTPKQGSAPESVYLKRLFKCLPVDRYVRPAQAVKDLDRFQHKHGDEISVLLFQLMRWARWCLSERQQGRGRIKVSSANRYLNAIAKPLIANGHHLKPNDLSGSDAASTYCALYDKISDACESVVERAYVEDRLKDFHGFLMTSIGAPVLEWRGHSFGAAIVSSRSNIITETDYQALLDAFDSLQSADRLSKRECLRLKVLAILLYRCGMRRSELEGRLISDLQGFDWVPGFPKSSSPQLWIHVVETTGVKNDWSARRIPIALLLDKKEINLFLKWCKQRRDESLGTKFSNTLLFAGSENPKATGDVASALDTIQSLIRAITGDEDLVIHHFRHSFISLTVARLFTLEVQPLAWSMYRHRVVGYFPKPCELRGVLAPVPLMKRLNQSYELPREVLYAIARIVGHRDPRETLQSYSHLLDLVLGLFVHAVSPHLVDRIEATLQGTSLSNIAVSRLRGRRNRAEVITYSPLIRRALVNRLISPLGTLHRYPKATQIANLDLAVAQATLKLPSLVQLHDLIRRAQLREGALARAQAFELSPEQVSKLVKAAHGLASATTNVRDPTKRRSRLLKGDSAPRGGRTRFSQVRGFAPALPVQTGERDEAQYIYLRLANALLERSLDVESLRIVLQRFSRSKSELFLGSAEEIEAASKVLKAARIGRDRVYVNVLSWHKDRQSSIVAALRKCLGIRKEQISVPSKLPLSRGRSDFGRLALHVRERGGLRDASGWKVACFFALVCIRALNETPMQKLV